MLNPIDDDDLVEAFHTECQDSEFLSIIAGPARMCDTGFRITP